MEYVARLARVQKLERLLNLTAVLLHAERPLAASEVRDKIPGYPDGDLAFRRSFERDKEDLRELGVPIELSPIPGADPPVDGYLIPRKRYYLPDPGLDPDELAALQLAAATIRVGEAAGADTLWKLGGLGDRPGPVSAALPSDPNLGPLFEAISTRSPVRFDYRGEGRLVHPYRLGLQLGHWYLRGHDVGRDAIRVFRVDRIEGDATVEAPAAFQIPDAERGSAEILPDRWALGDDPPQVARLRIDAEHAPMALTQFDPDDVVEQLADGAIEVVVTVTNRAAFRSLVLSFLDHAEILEQPELRDELIAWLRAIDSTGSESGPR